MKRAQRILGRFIKTLREAKGLTLEKFASKAGISYQYLSGVENGSKNFTVVKLEQLASALDLDVQDLVELAYSQKPLLAPPEIDAKSLRRGVPMPPRFTLSALERSLNSTQRIIFEINERLQSVTGKPLQDYIQANNFSGVVSNILCDALHKHSPYKHNSGQRYPDLITVVNGRRYGLEVKTTCNVGKGGESHNGHPGWHLVTCYNFVSNSNILFVHAMLAKLNGHKQRNPDWKYLGSSVNPETGSQRTETYITNGFGTTKLRDGSAYLDPNYVNFSRWRPTWQKGAAPEWSIFRS